MKTKELMDQFYAYIKKHKYVVVGLAVAIFISGGIIIYQITQPQPTKDKDKVAVVEKKDKKKDSKTEKKSDEVKSETKKEEAPKTDEAKAESKTEAKSESKTETRSGSKKQESTSKPSSSSTSTSNSNKSSKPKCRTETVTIPEKGHNEPYLISDAVYEDRPVYKDVEYYIGNQSGLRIPDGVNPNYYLLNNENGDFSFRNAWERVQVSTERVKVKDAVYGERWVVDQPARTETRQVCE